MFCRSFTQPLTPAVDAVATFPAFTCELLIAPRESFCRNDADAPDKRLHTPLQQIAVELSQRASHQLLAVSFMFWLKADSRKLMALSEEGQHPCNPLLQGRRSAHVKHFTCPANSTCTYGYSLYIVH